MERVVLWHRCFPPTRLELDAPEVVERWLEELRLRAYTVGGKVLARAGGSLAVAFETHDLELAIDLALDILEEADAGALGGLPVAIGVGAGPLTESPEGMLGAAIDRAQVLANLGREGELVLDPRSQALAQSTFLFERGVGAGAAALRGATIDRRVPRRATCRLSIAYLGRPSVPQSLHDALAEVKEMAASKVARCAALRAPSGTGAAGYLQALADSLCPPLVLHMAGVPGALEPLGSLRYALRRARFEPGVASPDVERLLKRLSNADPPPRLELIEQLGTFFSSLGRPWVVIDPVGLVDMETLRLVAQLVRDIPLFVVIRSPVEAPLPPPFESLGFNDFVLPPLRTEDTKWVARTILGDEDTPDEIVRRVAVLGGDTVLGVEEAARTLVASGDLIHDGESFQWRGKPRGGAQAIPIDALLQERLSSLEKLPMRMLEAVCVCPLGVSSEELAFVASADDLDDPSQADALSRLRQEALIRRDGEPSSEHLRQLVLLSMPPARSAELHRFFADAITTQNTGPLAWATVGFCQAEGGQPAEGASGLLEAATAALALGYQDGARRLAAAAVQLYPSAQTRTLAAQVSRAAIASDDARPREDSISLRAVHALLQGDVEAVERTLDAAVAEGRDISATDRMRAMALLARGDTAGAMAAMARARDARGPRAPAKTRTRDALTLAWIFLQAGQMEDCVRAALDALGSARMDTDARGQVAALKTLASAYTRVQRLEDAERILAATAGPE